MRKSWRQFFSCHSLSAAEHFTLAPSAAGQARLSGDEKMKTIVIEIDEAQPQPARVQLAADFLRQGKLVAFPTETVYGIGANALSAEAAAKIYQAKGRPSDNPLIVHLAEWTEATRYVEAIDERVERLAAAFWPGPLTMIFKKRDNIPSTITGGLNTVGIRIPRHPVARAILRACGLPIAAPSANLSGRPSPTEFAHVAEDLNGRVDMIIRSGSAEVGLESTVIDMSREIPVILRPGAVTQSMIETVIGGVRINRGSLKDSEVPVAPGMKYRHYAPKGKVSLLPPAGEAETLAALRAGLEAAARQGRKAAALVPAEYAEQLSPYLCFSLGSRENPAEIACHLFDGLRFMDSHQVEEIFAVSYPEEGLGEAIMNRLRKAAGK